MTFVRTVLADVAPGDLGITYAHEHVIIDGGRPVLLEPDFDLGEIDRMTREAAEAASVGLGAVVDAMPCDAGRSAAKLAEVSRRTGVHVIASTGLHHERCYGPAHWSHRVTVEELADLFVADIESGIDANDYAGPVVHRTPHRAGVHVLLGMDAARQGYYTVYGGGPGLTWLLARSSRAMEAAGPDAAARRTVLVENPARSFVFVPRVEGASR